LVGCGPAGFAGFGFGAGAGAATSTGVAGAARWVDS
jgi:hypothetical protein